MNLDLAWGASDRIRSKGIDAVSTRWAAAPDIHAQFAAHGLSVSGSMPVLFRTPGQRRRAWVDHAVVTAGWWQSARRASARSSLWRFQARTDIDRFARCSRFARIASSSSDRRPNPGGRVPCLMAIRRRWAQKRKTLMDDRFGLANTRSPRTIRTSNTSRPLPGCSPRATSFMRQPCFARSDRDNVAMKFALGESMLPLILRG